MTMVSGEFSKLLSVRDTYNQIKMGWVDNDPPSMYGKLFNESSKSLWETKDYGLIGLGEYQDWGAESDTIIPDDADTEYTWTYTMAYYALQFAVTKKMRDFNQWDFVAKCAKSLGRAARQTIETQAFNVFNRAFNSSYTGGDGKELCATDHPNAYDGSNIANEPSTATDFTPDALYAAINYYDTLEDERGHSISLTPRMIVAHPNNRKTIAEVLNSTLAPYTAENQKNFFTDLSLEAVFSSKLTDTDAWFVLTKKDQNGLNIFWKYKPQIDHYVDNETKNIVYQGHFCRAIGWTGFRWIYGSPGA